jgi:DUF4097 and DUF4098 domain-containing protein YvlB
MEVTEGRQKQLRRGKQVIAICVLLAINSVASLAQNQAPKMYQQGPQWVEEFSGFAPLSHVLKVMMSVGAIHLEGGGQDQITYMVQKRCVRNTQEAARKIFDQFRVFSARKANMTVLQGDWLGGKYINDLIADVFVKVPNSVDAVALNAHEGNITVRAIRAKLDAETSAGNIDLDQIAGAVKAHTAGGFITAGTLNGDADLRSGAGNVQAKSVSGRATLWTAGGVASLGAARTCSVETLAGNIFVRQCGGNLRAVSGGGSIDLGDISGDVFAQTGGGRIRLSSATGHVIAATGGGSVELHKVARGAQVDSGVGAISVEFAGTPRSFSDSYLRTASGDVIVYMSDGLPITVHAASDMTRGPGIMSDFPEIRITSEGGNYGPKSMFAEGALNGGGPVLKVRTTIGQIEFHRTK